MTLFVLVDKPTVEDASHQGRYIIDCVLMGIKLIELNTKLKSI